MNFVDFMSNWFTKFWAKFTFFDEKFFFVLAIFGAVALVQGLKSKKD